MLCYRHSFAQSTYIIVAVLQLCETVCHIYRNYWQDKGPGTTKAELSVDMRVSELGLEESRSLLLDFRIFKRDSRSRTRKHE